MDTELRCESDLEQEAAWATKWAANRLLASGYSEPFHAESCLFRAPYLLRQRSKLHTQGFAGCLVDCQGSIEALHRKECIEGHSN